jgi:hypothetical protein
MIVDNVTVNEMTGVEMTRDGIIDVTVNEMTEYKTIVDIK